MAEKRKPRQRGEVKTIHLYFSAQDADLLLLHSKRFLPEAIRVAVRRYLTGDPENEIPLLPYAVQAARGKHISVYLYAEKDGDIIQFVESVPTGGLNQVIKVLLRNAYAKPDLRQWMDPNRRSVRQARGRSDKVQTAKENMKVEKEKLIPEQESTDEDLDFRNEEDPFAGI